MKKYTFKKDGFNCLDGADLGIYGGMNNRASNNYIGDPIDKLAKYEALEDKLHKLSKNQDENIVENIINVFIETIFKGQKHEGFEILTNEDAKLYNELLKTRREDSYYFEEFRDKYTHDMLDKPVDNNPKYMLLGDWIMQFKNDGYFDSNIKLDELTDSELSHLVDLIQYLETK